MSGDPARTLRVDLARFTTAGLGTVHGAAAEGLLPGDAVLVADEDFDVRRPRVRQQGVSGVGKSVDLLD